MKCTQINQKSFNEIDRSIILTHKQRDGVRYETPRYWCYKLFTMIVNLCRKWIVINNLLDRKPYLYHFVGFVVCYCCVRMVTASTFRKRCRSASSFVYQDSSSDRTQRQCVETNMWMFSRRVRRVGVVVANTDVFCGFFSYFFFAQKCYSNHYMNDEQRTISCIFLAAHIYLLQNRRKNYMTDRFLINCWNQRNFYEWIRSFEWDVRLGSNENNNFFSGLLLTLMGNVLLYILYNNMYCIYSSTTIELNDTAQRCCVHFTFNECYRFIFSSMWNMCAHTLIRCDTWK